MSAQPSTPTSSRPPTWHVAVLVTVRLTIAVLRTSTKTPQRHFATGADVQAVDDALLDFRNAYARLVNAAARVLATPTPADDSAREHVRLALQGRGDLESVKLDEIRRMSFEASAKLINVKNVGRQDPELRSKIVNAANAMKWAAETEWDVRIPIANAGL